MKIFGREPTLWLASISAILGVVVTFGFDWLTVEQAAWIVAVLNGVLGAINVVKVRPVPPAVITYLGSSFFSLLAAYGLDVAQETVGAINLAMLTVLMLLTRGQVSPTDSKPGGDGPTTDSREWG